MIRRRRAVVIEEPVIITAKRAAITGQHTVLERSEPLRP
jgi:hypothetical protein